MGNAAKSVGKVVGGKSTTDRLQGAAIGGLVGGPMGAIAGGAVGSSGIKKATSGLTDALKPASAKPYDVQKTDTSGLMNTADQGAKSLGAAIAAQQAKMDNMATPQMQAMMADRGQVQNVGAQTGAQTQAAQINTAQSDEMRARQIALGDQLAAQASGQAPSIAAMQAKQQGDRALAAQLAVNAGKSGSASPLALRTAAQNQATIGADIANQSAVLRLQEQQAAQKAMGDFATATRQQDISLAQNQAELENQANLANLSAQTADADRVLKANMANQGVDLDVIKANAVAGNAAAQANLSAELTKMGLDNNMQIAFLQNQLGMTKLQAEAQIEAARIKSNESIAQAAGANQVSMANTAGKNSQMAGILGAGATLGAAAIAASDVNLKENITSDKSSGRLGDFLSKLDVYSYDYKDSKFGKGKQTSIMAQDLEQSDIGKSAVINTKEGKMVNYAKLLPAMLAANVDSHKRIATLEEALAAKKGKK